MNIACPHCQSLTARKNGSTPNGKQKFQCISCLKQFVEDPQNKIISVDIKERIRRSLKASGEALMNKLPEDLKKSPLLH